MKDSLDNYRTLVLNADFTPINLLHLEHIPVQDAITRVFNGTCFVVSEYDRVFKTPNTEYAVNLPAVIARKQYKNIPHEISDNPVAEYLYYRDHAICAYSGRELTLSRGRPNSISIDHVVPKSKGGDNTWTNVVAAAESINQVKDSNLPVGEWAPKHKPYKPTYHDLVRNRRNFPITVYHESWKDYIGPWNAEIKVMHYV